MAPSHILQISLRVTVQNQVRIAKWDIVDEVVQFCPLRHGHIQRVLNLGAVDGSLSPIPEQQLHAAVWNEPELSFPKKKRKIRTLLLSRKGSDLHCLVRWKGLEPPAY